jgi:hypothetical protein
MSGGSRRDRDAMGDTLPSMMSPKERAAYIATGVALRPSKILKRLWLGDKNVVSQEDVLVDCGITHILNLHGSAEQPSKGFRYMHYPMSDSGKDNLGEVLEDIAPFVKEALATGRLLIHCNLGQNRSVCVAMALLLQLEPTWELGPTFSYVAARHHQVLLNRRYMRQLEAMALHRAPSDDEQKHTESD